MKPASSKEAHPHLEAGGGAHLHDTLGGGLEKDGQKESQKLGAGFLTSFTYISSFNGEHTPQRREVLLITSQKRKLRLRGGVTCPVSGRAGTGRPTARMGDWRACRSAGLWSLSRDMLQQNSKGGSAPHTFHLRPSDLPLGQHWDTEWLSDLGLDTTVPQVQK